MTAKLTRLTHKIAIQLHLVAESYTICNSRSRRPVRKLFGYNLLKFASNIIEPINELTDFMQIMYLILRTLTSELVLVISVSFGIIKFDMR
jgi:hypothetical protein